MSIGKILIDLRQERGISQKQLADAIGISQSTIAKIEVNRNEATASTLRKISDFFEISSDYLLERSSDLFAIPSSTSSHLSPEEQKLIEGYRKLAPNLRQTIQELIEFGSQSNSTKRKGEIS